MLQLPEVRRIGQTKFNKLYHYEKFKAEHLSATLRDMKLHCSNPANFNDPWDCAPWFHEKTLENPETLEKIFAQQRKLNPNGLPENVLHQFEDRVRGKEYERVNLNAGFSESNIIEIRKRLLYCLTPHPDSTLMWSHYAEHHKGICLEFGIDNPLISQAVEVLYPDEYPIWSPVDFEDEHDRAIEMIITKAQPWKYEDEFRLISLHNNDIATPLRVENGCFSLPPTALLSVITGCNADHDAIKAIVRLHMPSLPVKKAIRIENQFDLLIFDEDATD